MDEKPIFVKIDEYEDIRDILNLIRKKILEARDAMDKVNQLKHEEESELDLWKSEIDDVEKKIAYIDEALFTGAE